MIPLIFRFLIYNLLPGLVSGLMVWLLIYTAITILQVRKATLRLPLLYAAVVKSILVTLGIGLVLPWPRWLFTTWHSKALPLGNILPIYLLWTGLAMLFGYLLVRRARKIVVQGALPAQQIDNRLESAINLVLKDFQNQPARQTGEGWICCRTGTQLSRPELWISEKVDTPLVVRDLADPVIVFPLGLSEQLDQTELEMVLAHEVAHLTLQRPICCASNTVKHFAYANPLALLLGSRLQYEEEKACDDLAVTLLGQPEKYAQALLKSYRFAGKHSNKPNWMRLGTTFRLSGAKAGLTGRIERLMDQQDTDNNLWLQRCITCLLWVFVAVLLG